MWLVSELRYVDGGYPKSILLRLIGRAADELTRLEKKQRILTDGDVRARLNAACEEAGGARPFARRHGISSSHVTETLNGSRAPAPQVAKALGIVRAWVEEER